MVLVIYIISGSVSASGVLFKAFLKSTLGMFRVLALRQSFLRYESTSFLLSRLSSEGFFKQVVYCLEIFYTVASMLLRFTSGTPYMHMLSQGLTTLAFLRNSSADY